VGDHVYRGARTHGASSTSATESQSTMIWHLSWLPLRVDCTILELLLNSSVGSAVLAASGSEYGDGAVGLLVYGLSMANGIQLGCGNHGKEELRCLSLTYRLLELFAYGGTTLRLNHTGAKEDVRPFCTLPPGPRTLGCEILSPSRAKSNPHNGDGWAAISLVGFCVHQCWS
jgi:hypothetical protein